MPEFKTDMPTLVIDDKTDKNNWFAFVKDYETIGFISSLPEAVGKAAEMGINPGYLVRLSNPNLQTTLGISSCIGSYQNVNKKG
ncbi:MAG: hypothetical protein KME47_09810 [Nodosilinea sp. WJT8-NPBG4]|jgi:hypothetical protein|nr:hypothetical protein [Nodosilinea sp. WJT8-NPBG4]